VVHRKQGKKYIFENDSEHCYNLAMTAWYLGQYFPELDRDKLIRLALVHDLVEIHAGDTFAYGPSEHIASKQAREHAAYQQLRADWPDFAEGIADIKTYESLETPEAAFVYALDKIMPMMQVFLNDGYTWKQEGISLDMQHTVKSPKISRSAEINEYYMQLHKLFMQHPEAFGSATSTNRP
jgi:putative hydrolase of HD superfamily